MQQEAAMKFAGIPNETEFSVLWKPWFDFTIIRRVDRQMFHPVPAVQPVLFHIIKKKEPDIGYDQRELYIRFVKHGFEAWKKSLKQAYQDVFSYTQWKRLARELGFNIQPKPTQLTYTQWLGLYSALLKHVPKDKWNNLRS
jgi:23S rRNA (adenine-N6)-dimethyltransferase